MQGVQQLWANVTTTGNQLYGSGGVTLTASSTLSGANIVFNGPLSGSGFALALIGNAEFDSTVALGSLNVSGSAVLAGPAVTTAGSQIYSGTVSVVNDSALTDSAGSILFSSLVQSSGGAHALTVAAPGTITFRGAVGVGGNPLASLTIGVPVKPRATLYSGPRLLQRLVRLIMKPCCSKGAQLSTVPRIKILCLALL